MTNTPVVKRSIKARIKHRTPELIVGGSLVLGAVSIFYFHKLTTDINLSVPTPDDIEILSGVEEAFVTMSKEAFYRLQENGSLMLAEMDDFNYMLEAIPK